MIHLIAEIKAASGCEAALEALLKGLLEPTREENGCCQYELFADQQIPGLYIMQEIWCSQESLDQHLVSEHFNHFKQESDRLELVEYVQLRPMNFIG